MLDTFVPPKEYMESEQRQNSERSGDEGYRHKMEENWECGVLRPEEEGGSRRNQPIHSYVQWNKAWEFSDVDIELLFWFYYWPHWDPKQKRFIKKKHVYQCVDCWEIWTHSVQIKKGFTLLGKLNFLIIRR